MLFSGAQIVWETLIREGVDVVFGYPGGANLPIYDALYDFPIHHVLVRHEQGAAHAADGYARASGKVGVCMATSGPGATNLVTGIATAMMDSSPMVCITGQVHGHLIGSDAFQEVDVTGITLPITKHNYLVNDVNEISRTLREAFFIARSGRPGPVLIDITKDAQQATIEWEYDASPIQLPGYRPDFSPAINDLEKAVEMIHVAKRPVILAGNGVLKSGAMDRVLQFAEKTDTPVSMTLLGLGGFPASHSLNLGMMGMHGEALANQAIQEADLLLAFGMRFDDRVTGTLSTYAPNARKIHFDQDPSEINKVVHVDLALIGDLGETLKKLLPLLNVVNHKEWLEYLSMQRNENDKLNILKAPDNGVLYAAQVIDDILKATEGNAIIVTDVGQNQMWAAQYYKHEHPYRMITSGGLGTMGFGLPAAVGVKMACPDQEVWVIAGDGGFQMTQMELQTIKQENIKINIALLNNGYLGMVRQWQQFFYSSRYSETPISSPDFVLIAEAHGLNGLRAGNRSEAAEMISKARETEGTVLVDFRIEREDCVYPMVPAGASLNTMIRRPIRTETNS
jgi:acetolactate synthase-1/2/3 large subunit